MTDDLKDKIATNIKEINEDDNKLHRCPDCKKLVRKLSNLKKHLPFCRVKRLESFQSNSKQFFTTGVFDIESVLTINPQLCKVTEGQTTFSVYLKKHTRKNCYLVEILNLQVNTKVFLTFKFRKFQVRLKYLSKSFNQRKLMIPDIVKNQMIIEYDMRVII